MFSAYKLRWVLTFEFCSAADGPYTHKHTHTHTHTHRHTHTHTHTHTRTCTHRSVLLPVDLVPTVQRPVL